MTHTAIHAGAPLDPVEHDTLARLFLGAVDRHADREASRAKSGGEWVPLTYREVEDRVLALAALLARWGVARGDRVVLLSENRPEWAIVDYATLLLGAVTVPLYPTLPADQVLPIVQHCEPRVLVASTADQLAKLRGVEERLPGPARVVGLDAPTEGGERLSDLVSAAPPLHAAARRALREAARAIGPDDLATLIYTSGTTGSPKGVMLSHGNLARMVAATRQHGSIPVEPGDVALSVLPLSHVFERAADYFFFDRGVTIAYAESFERVAANLQEVRPHAMLGVPRFFERVHARVMKASGARERIVRWAGRVGGAYADARLTGKRVPATLALRHRVADRLVFSRLREATGGRVRAFISGGAPLSAEVARFFFAAGLPVYEGYGLTETSPVLTANRPEQTRLGSVGVPYPGVELRIAEEGEILARAPGVMRGYWRDPEATAAAVDAEGWFHTGDVGRFDEAGFLFITDRLKDLIVTSGGKNIAPQPLEAQATRSPYVAQAVLIGDRRAHPVMLVVPELEAVREWARRQGVHAADLAGLMAHPEVHALLQREVLAALDGLAGYQRPRRVAVLPEPLTVENGLLTPTLKVRRRAVETRFAELIGSLYAG